MSIEAMKLALASIQDLRGYRPDIDKAIEALRDAISQQPATGEPDEWKLVPIVPTEKMLLAYTGGAVTTSGFRWCRHQWSAMLAAAPAAAPQQAEAQATQAVPMTDEQRQSAFLSAPTSSGGHRTAFMLGIQFAEFHHGIVAQAKKEGA